MLSFQLHYIVAKQFLEKKRKFILLKIDKQFFPTEYQF